MWLRQVPHLLVVAPILIQVESLGASTHPWESNHTLRKVTVYQPWIDPRYQEFLWIKSIFKPHRSLQRTFQGYHPGIVSFSEQNIFILDSVSIMCDWETNFSQTHLEIISCPTAIQGVCVSVCVCAWGLSREQQVVQYVVQCQEKDKHLLYRRHCVIVSPMFHPELQRQCMLVSLNLSVWLR